MSKSLNVRLDRAYRLLFKAQSCTTCGLSEDDWPVEIYVGSTKEPKDPTYLPNPPDFTRCPTCNAPSTMIFWEPVDREISLEAFEDNDETITS